MSRPTILVAEPEPNEALSVRKLVLETAKFSVLTAHSNEEALNIFRLFPNVDLIVVVGGGRINAELIASTMKKTNNRIPVIALTPHLGQKYECADYTLSSHEPEELVALVRSLEGDPKKMEEYSTPQSHSVEK